MGGSADDGSALVSAGMLALLYAGVWIGVFRLAAWWGGWARLARAYPAGGVGPEAGVVLRWRSLTLGRWTGYKHCVSLAATPRALRISLPWIFSPGHAPLEIPWRELRAVRGRLWGVPVITLHPARTPGLALHLRAPSAEALARASAGALRIPPAGRHLDSGHGSS